MGEVLEYVDSEGKWLMEDFCKFIYYNGSGKGIDFRIVERNYYRLSCGFIS